MDKRKKYFCVVAMVLILLSGYGKISDSAFRMRVTRMIAGEGMFRLVAAQYRQKAAEPVAETASDRSEKEDRPRVALTFDDGPHATYTPLLLDVYNFKKKERKKEVQELEQEKENLTAENEGLTSQIVDARADIKLLEEEKIQFQKDKEIAEKRAEKAETELKKLEDRREFLQPVMDNVSKEIKEYGMIKTFLPEAGTFERAVPYRENKIKPLFIKMKNQIAVLAGKVVELNKTVENWKNKYQKSVEKCDNIQKQLDDVRKENGKLSNDNQRLQEISDRYDRVVRILGMETVEDVVQQDIKEQRALEEKRRTEQMPKGSVLKQLEWATQKSQIENQQRKKNKTKYKGLEI